MNSRLVGSVIAALAIAAGVVFMLSSATGQVHHQPRRRSVERPMASLTSRASGRS